MYNGVFGAKLLVSGFFSIAVERGGGNVSNDDVFFSFFSDTMGNQGAFINIKGNDLTPKFTSYKAVVSYLVDSRM